MHCPAFFFKMRLPMFRKLLLASFLGLSLYSCTKNEDEIISGNTPPPDYTQPASLRVSFINKSYISLLGREPNASEYDAAKSSLDAANFSKSARKSLITGIVAQDEFYDREFELYGNDLLNSTDTSEVTEMILVYEFLLTNPTYQEYWPALEVEINRMEALLAVPEGLKNGTVSLKEMQRRCVDNYFFDQINMGSLNFVLACFQHLLLRNPTEFEKTEGVKMVDGFDAILFLTAGQSKTEFENIFFASDDYYEGQVKLAFYRFLLRLPTSEEEAYYSNMLKSSNDYKALFIELLGTDEYAGIK